MANLAALWPLTMINISKSIKHLLTALFMLSVLSAKSQTFISITAGPQALSPKQSAPINPRPYSPTRPKNGIAFTFEPEWRKGNHFTFGVIFSHAQFGFEKHNNSSVSQAMLNFKIPFTIKRIQPYIAVGTGYLNYTANEMSYEAINDRYTQENHTTLSGHYVGLSPSIGLTWIVTQRFRITANYRYTMGIYSQQKFLYNPISSGFNIGINLFVRSQYTKA